MVYIRCLGIDVVEVPSRGIATLIRVVIQPCSTDEKKVKQDKARKLKDEKQLGTLRCAPGKATFGLDGYVPIVRSTGLSVELQAKASTDWPGKCHLCGTKGHTALECDHKVEVDGETVYPLAYLFQKGLVDKWGVITEKKRVLSQVSRDRIPPVTK